MMTKRGAIIKFCVIGLLTAVGVAMIFVNFRVPFTTTRFNGFAGAIESRMGIDLVGGILAVFDVEPQNPGDPHPDETAVRATRTRLENALNSAGFVEATVQIQGEGRNARIRVEVPGLDEADEIFAAIGDPATLDFRLSPTDIHVVAADISSVAIHQGANFEWGVLLTFTNEGGRNFRNMIQQVGQGGTTYIYRNGQQWRPINVQDTAAGANNTTFITLGGHRDGSGAPATRRCAEDFQLQIESGLFEVRLQISETSNIPQTLGEGALTGSLIALIVGIVFMFLFMFFRYGDLGLLSNLSLIIYMVLFMGALAIVPAVQLTLPGIAGIIISLAMAVDANIIIFEAMKDEYRSGKRMSVSVQNGFRKSLWTIFDANITTIVGATVLFFLGTGPIQGFAITLMLGVIISMYCSLVLTRSFAKLYLRINPNNPKRLRLVNTNPYIAETGTVSETPKPTVKRKLNLGGSK
ncbi:MAG: SecD/SecF family protein translocase subunit [Firmicutes bacterium]|nr:SecD/SecF family protein translocase subunit [Bacillota bacterium]